eukprot:1929193-Rhodomonas_salina.3
MPYLERLWVKDRDGTVASPRDNLPVRRHLDAHHTLAHPCLRPQDVATRGSRIAKLVRVVDEDIVDGPLKFTEVAIRRSHLAVCEIEVPHAQRALSSGDDDELVVASPLDWRERRNGGREGSRARRSEQIRLRRA